MRGRPTRFRPPQARHLAARFGLGYLRGLDGTGSRASTPDHADFDITGDVDLRALVYSDNPSGSGGYETYISKGDVVGYWLQHKGATTQLRFGWDSASTFEDSDSGIVVAGPRWYRATLDVDDGASGHVVTFYYSDDPVDTSPDSVAWTSHTVRTTAGVASIAANTEAVWLGDMNLDLSELAGRIYYAEIRNGINGTIVGSPDFRDRDQISTPYTVLTDPQSKVWTINSPAWWVLPLQKPLTAAGAPQTVDPAVLALTLTLSAPQVDLTVLPGVLSLTLTLSSPQVNLTVHPSLLGVPLTLFTPQVNLTVLPDLLSLPLTLSAPQVNMAVAADLLNLTLDLFTPQVNLTVLPAVHNMGLTLFDPIVIGAQTVDPALLSIPPTLFTPTIDLAGAVQTIVPHTYILLTPIPFEPTVYGEQFVQPTADLAMGLTLHPPRMSPHLLKFTPPAVGTKARVDWYRLGAEQRQKAHNRLYRFYNQDSIPSVIITAGVVQSRFTPSTEIITAADPGSGYADKAVFLGGRKWTVTSAEKVLLVAAGYSVDSEPE